MALDMALFEWVKEAMAPIGAVTVRRMMGGATLYCDGTIFAIISGDGDLWFKADAESDRVWDAEGCPRFTMEMNGRLASMNYRRAPDTVYDDEEALRRWARLGLEAGARAPARKPRKSKSL